MRNNPLFEMYKGNKDAPYYARYEANPDLPRPIEPCNNFEHPTRWALVAYWEKAKADRLEAQRDKLIEAAMAIDSWWHLPTELRTIENIEEPMRKIKNALEARAAIEKVKAEK